MSFALSTLLEQLHLAVLPMVRILTMLTVAPVIGTAMVSLRVRMGLALALAVMLSPVVPMDQLPDVHAGSQLSVIAVEVLAGVVAGVLLRLVFGVLELASQVIALQVGLGFGELIDPQNALQGPTLSQVYLVSGTLIFLALDGHLMLVATIVQSFYLLPMGSTVELTSLVAISRFGSTMFAGAVLIAIPATAALLTVNIAVGVLTRAVPQFNMFVAFPGILLLGLIAISLTLSGLIPQFSGLIEDASALTHRLLVAK